MHKHKGFNTEAICWLDTLGDAGVPALFVEATPTAPWRALHVEKGAREGMGNPTAHR